MVKLAVGCFGELHRFTRFTRFFSHEYVKFVLWGVDGLDLPNYLQTVVVSLSTRIGMLDTVLSRVFAILSSA